jgi:hypothetical protein
MKIVVQIGTEMENCQVEENAASGGPQGNNP